MLKGEEGRQVRELDNLVDWMGNLPHPDAVFLSNALLVGLCRQIQTRLKTRVLVFLQSEESFLDSMDEPWRTESWKTLSERGRDVDAWVAPSRYFAERMTMKLKLDPTRVHVVHNGISLVGYETLVRPVNPYPVLGYFARMCEDKGLDLVVDAFIALHQRGKLPELRLRIGGGCGPSDEPFVNQQKIRLSNAGLLDRVEFHPNVSRENKLRFYASCDVLSVPSRQSEAFGLYVIESLAAGTPLIQPSVATFPELIQETGGGVLYGPNDSTSLATALEESLLKPDALRALGEAGRKAVFERFNDEVMARKIADIARNLPPISQISTATAARC
jgi:glycosyltransferase involved in cell wall biosynthesis